MADAAFADEPFDRLQGSLAAGKRVLSATYRLQCQSRFTFDDARQLVPYLYELGVSDCYVSPILQAASKSSPGYDIANYCALNPDIGSEEAFRGCGVARRSAFDICRTTPRAFEHPERRGLLHHADRTYLMTATRGRNCEA